MSRIQKLVLACGSVCCLVVLVVVGTTSAQNLVVQWNFDEAAGGTVDANDTGDAPATTGVLGSTATRTNDTPGGGPGFALDLSAAGADTSIVNGGNPLEVDTLAQFTLTTWAKVTSDSDYNEGGSGNVRLLAKQSGGLFDGFSWNMNAPQLGSDRSQNAFTMGLFVGGDTDFAFSFASDDILDRGGEWLFLAVTYDGNSTADNTTFWIGDENNAIAQHGTTLSINSGPVFSTNTSNGGTANANFGVGFTDAAPGVDFAISGLQDDVRVYDGILDSSALDAVRVANLGSTTVLGDYDDDGFVGQSDLDLVLLNWGDNSPPAPAGWVNEVPDGLIGQAALDGVLLNWGNGTPPLVAAVPEPSTVMLALVALSMLVRIGRSSKTARSCNDVRID